jgi:hypothetical protein
LLQPVRPAVILTAGLSGTGKSVLAHALAPFVPPVPGALVLRSNVERKALFARHETERLPPEAYRPQTSKQLYSLLEDKAARIARAGHSVIVDAVFATASERSSIEALARDAGANFSGLFLTPDLATLLKRISVRGPDASDADATVARLQEEFDLGPLDWSEVDATGTPTETVARAVSILSR